MYIRQQTCQKFENKQKRTLLGKKNIWFDKNDDLTPLYCLFLFVVRK